LDFATFKDAETRFEDCAVEVIALDSKTTMNEAEEQETAWLEKSYRKKGPRPEAMGGFASTTVI